MSKAKPKQSRVTKALNAINEAKKKPAPAKAAKPAAKPTKPKKKKRPSAADLGRQLAEGRMDDTDQFSDVPTYESDLQAGEVQTEGEQAVDELFTDPLDAPLPDTMPGEQQEPCPFADCILTEGHDGDHQFAADAEQLLSQSESMALADAGDVDKFLDIHGKFRLTKTGLTVSGDPTFAEWESVGAILRTMEGAVQFWVADWVNYGEGQFKEKASQAIDATGWKYATIQQYSRVAAKVPPQNRRPQLSFSHHREVADLTSDQQAKWLDKAEQGSKGEAWSSTELRLQLNKKKKSDRKAKGEDVTPQKFWLCVECKSEQDRDELMASFTESGRTTIKAENFGPNALRERMGITAGNDLASVSEA